MDLSQCPEPCLESVGAEKIFAEWTITFKYLKSYLVKEGKLGLQCCTENEKEKVMKLEANFAPVKASDEQATLQIKRPQAF